MQITLTNNETELTNISADEFLESTEYDTEWEDILNQLESEQIDEIDFIHSDGTVWNIVKEIEIMEV